MSRYSYKRVNPFPAPAKYTVRLADGNDMLGYVWHGTGSQKWWWRTADGRHEGQGWESREAAARELQRRTEIAAYERAYSGPQRGWWNMVCWNGLSTEQQRTLIEKGTLPMGYKPHGSQCKNGAEVAVETMWDKAEGPRFYCTECAVQFLKIRKAVKTA